jgi:hypothetical protein
VSFVPCFHIILDDRLTLPSFPNLFSDLGEDVEKYIENKKNGGETLSGGCDHSHGNGTAPSLKKVEGSAAKAAVAAGAAVNSNGQIVNGQDGTA